MNAELESDCPIASQGVRVERRAFHAYQACNAGHAKYISFLGIQGVRRRLIMESGDMRQGPQSALPHHSKLGRDFLEDAGETILARYPAPVDVFYTTESLLGEHLEPETKCSRSRVPGHESGQAQAGSPGLMLPRSPLPARDTFHDRGYQALTHDIAQLQVPFLEQCTWV